MECSPQVWFTPSGPLYKDRSGDEIRNCNWKSVHFFTGFLLTVLKMTAQRQMYAHSECTIQKMGRKYKHIFYENLIHSYRSFGGSNKHVHRIKENTDSRT